MMWGILRDVLGAISKRFEQWFLVGHIGGSSRVECGLWWRRLRGWCSRRRGGVECRRGWGGRSRGGRRR